ncbi:MAG TPA: calcium-binding protein, partial [Burkholderiales bacterium]|nr:calcium-binding protein [Burkholderiales bacterium]
DDILPGLGGNDIINGFDGNDTLIGGLGADILNGGTGTDRASYAMAAAGVVANLTTPAQNTGEATGDTYASVEDLLGSAFADVLVGNGGANNLAGGDGNDYIEGRGGNDTLSGEAGDDRLEGGVGADTLVGGAGTNHATYYYAVAPVIADLADPSQNTGDAAGDSYSGIAGLIGSAGQDLLRGDANTNWLAGGGEYDELEGQGGDDFLLGMDGNDVLHGGPGADRLDGALGTDAASYAFSTAAVLANLSGSTQNTGDAVGDVYLSIEDLLGSAHNDTLIGSAAANFIGGNDGDDYIQGRAEFDFLSGGEGNDRLEGGTEGDTLNGGNGIDYAAYYYASGAVTANLANAASNLGDAAGDSYNSIEGLIGSEFADVLTGDANFSHLLGLGGDDTLMGGGGADYIAGMDGDDSLQASGSGAELNGGAGNDTFTFIAGEANGQSIVDFIGNESAVGDSIIFRGYGTAGDGATFLRISDSSQWQVTSADGTIQETITFQNNAMVDPTDFAFLPII